VKSFEIVKIREIMVTKLQEKGRPVRKERTGINPLIGKEKSGHRQCGTDQKRYINDEIARDMSLHCLPKSAVECILDNTQAAIFLNEKCTKGIDIQIYGLRFAKRELKE
jgi:hypothetical protein